MLILNICNNHKKYALSLRHRNQSIAKTIWKIIQNVRTEVQDQAQDDR